MLLACCSGRKDFFAGLADQVEEVSGWRTALEGSAKSAELGLAELGQRPMGGYCSVCLLGSDVEGLKDRLIQCDLMPVTVSRFINFLEARCGSTRTRNYVSLFLHKQAWCSKLSG